MAEIKSAPGKNIQPPVRKRAARPVVRWGVAALIAVSAAALTAETRSGAQRLEIAFAAAREPSRIFAQTGPSVSAGNLQTAQLSAAVRELSADRDRLRARIASLERALHETTGSITRQVKEVAATAESTAKKQAAMSAAPPTAIPSRPTNTTAAPLIAVPSFSLAPTPPYGPAPAQWSSQFVQQPQRRTSAVASLPIHGGAKREETPALKKEFAVDLGGGATVAMLWEQWVSVKASYGPLLTGLEPHYRRHRHGSGSAEYQLLAGPFADEASANRLCSILSTVHVDCRATTFDGAHLAVQ